MYGRTVIANGSGGGVSPGVDEQRQEPGRLAADDRSPRGDLRFGDPVDGRVGDEVVEVDDHGHVGQMSTGGTEIGVGCCTVGPRVVLLAADQRDLHRGPAGDDDRVGADPGGLADAGVVVDPGLRGVGDAAVAGQQVDVGERRLRVGGDDRCACGNQSGTCSVTTMSVDVASLERRAAFADVQQPSGGDALAVDADGAGRDEVARIARPGRGTGAARPASAGRRRRAAASAPPTRSLLADLGGQHRCEAGEELGDDLRA